MPESPSPFLGRDILRKVHASVFINMEPVLLIEDMQILQCGVMEKLG